jgi:hypothetical protein
VYCTIQYDTYNGPDSAESETEVGMGTCDLEPTLSCLEIHMYRATLPCSLDKMSVRYRAGGLSIPGRMSPNPHPSVTHKNS